MSSTVISEEEDSRMMAVMQVEIKAHNTKKPHEKINISIKTNTWTLINASNNSV